MNWLINLLMFWRKPEKTMSIDDRRSMVRVWVTHMAAWYVFGGSVALIGFLWVLGPGDPRMDVAKDVFMTVLPVATGVITYWFANRSTTSDSKSDQSQTKPEIADGNDITPDPARIAGQQEAPKPDDATLVPSRE